MSALINEKLIRAAENAMRNSYSPYSGFAVGAALETADGEIFTGCNIENASFSLTCCGERTAFFKAISLGKNKFSKIAVVGGKNAEITDYCPPCGACRQVMAEFCDSDFEIILFNGKNEKIYSISELLPLDFSLEE